MSGWTKKEVIGVCSLIIATLTVAVNVVINIAEPELRCLLFKDCKEQTAKKPQDKQEDSPVQPSQELMPKQPEITQTQKEPELGLQQQELEKTQSPHSQTVSADNSAKKKLVWRSQSGLTRIENLDRICWGESNVNSVATVFEFDRGKLPVAGTIQVDSSKTSGCAVGESLSGYFQVSGNGVSCEGNVTVTWRDGNNGYLQWFITNSGSSCPVNQTNWSINTYPVKVY